MQMPKNMYYCFKENVRIVSIMDLHVYSKYVFFRHCPGFTPACYVVLIQNDPAGSVYHFLFTYFNINIKLC